MHLTNRIYLTIVHKSYEADTFFPEINMNDWKETSHDDYQADEKNATPYSFITLERI